MTTIWTKEAANIFAALDGSLKPRMIDAAETATWGTEVENAIGTLEAGLDGVIEGIEIAQDAALNSKGIFGSTSDALSNGVIGTTALVGGSGGTNGTFDVAFSGGGGSGAAARFTVSSGALVSIVMTAAGKNYTSAPSLSFAASAGLTGASATAQIGANCNVGEFFEVPVTGSDTAVTIYRVDAGPVATALATAPSTTALVSNMWPDPFGEQIEDAPYLRLSASSYQPAYAGTITRPSSYAGWGKTGLVQPSGSLASRSVSLQDLGAIAGETWTFATAWNFAAASNTVTLIFFNASAGTISSTTLMNAVGSGYREATATVTIPATTAYVMIRGSSSAGQVELLAVAVAKGSNPPKFTAAPRPFVRNDAGGSAKLNPDPFFRLANAGQTVDYAGYALIGTSVAGTPALVAAPALSPFATKAVSLAAGTTLHDFKSPVAECGLRVGEPIELIIGVIAAQSIQFVVSIGVSSGTAHTETTTVNPAVSGGLGYREIVLSFTPTANDVTYGTYALMRLSISGGVSASGAYVVGWAVQKNRTRLIDNAGLTNKIAAQVAAIQANPHASKKMVHFGDSLIAGTGSEGIGISPVIASRTGMVVTQSGFGGCRMGAHSGDYDKFSFYQLAASIAANNFSAQVTAANNLYTSSGGSVDFRAKAAALAATDWSTVDYLFVSYGTNDFTATSPTVPIGTNADTTGATFKGAINAGIAAIAAARPNIKMFFTSPTWRRHTVGATTDSADVLPNAAGVYLIAYVDALLEVCALNHVPAVDMYRNSTTNQYNHATYLIDGTHQNDAGSRLYGGKMSAGFLSKF